jgi:ribosomal protein S27AE
VGEELADLVASGLSIEEAAKRVGIHPATVYRWQNRYPRFREAMDAAENRRFRLLHPPESYRRPRVPWRKDCPDCGAAVVVRTTWWMLKFWTCERWPQCSFSSWRPPALISCPACGGAMFWAHSRKSLGCDACGHREKM